MTLASCGALAAALLLAAPPQPQPQKQSWDSANRPQTEAVFLPRSARVEVDGQVRGAGDVLLPVTDPKQVFKVRVTAEGFEPLEVEVEGAEIARRRYLLALRPLGMERKVEMNDAPSLALAASALWRAGRADDAADYAEQSLRNGNTALANRILGEVWRRRGDRDQATRFFTMYLSLVQDPPEAAEIRAWLLQDRPGDITIPAK